MTEDRIVQRWDVDPLLAAQRALTPLCRPYGPAADVPDHVLRRIIDAVLATFDHIVDHTHTCWAEQWDRDERLRADVRRRMRLDLLSAVTEQGFVPVSLPMEEITRTRVGPFGDEPAGAAENVVIRLRVAVRAPSVDRAKAVAMGILHG